MVLRSFTSTGRCCVRCVVTSFAELLTYDSSQHQNHPLSSHFIPALRLHVILCFILGMITYLIKFKSIVKFLDMPLNYLKLLSVCYECVHRCAVAT
jgi:uncharacterized membrane protein